MRPNPRRCRLGLMWLLLAACAFGSATAADGAQHESEPDKKDILALPVSETREFFRQDEVFQAAFLVELSDPETWSAQKIGVEILEVAHGNAAPDELQDRFTVSLNERRIAGTYELRVAAASEYHVEPGTYKFLIGVREKALAPKSYRHQLTLTASQPPDPGEFVKLLAGDTVEMEVTKKNDDKPAEFPIELANGIKELDLKVIDATYDARRIAGLRKHFDVRLEPEDDPNHITVRVEDDNNLGPGTFNFTLELKARNPPSRQTLELKVTQPEATLTQLGTLHHTRRIWPLQDSTDGDNGPDIELELADTASYLTGVEITQPQSAKLEGEDIDSRAVVLSEPLKGEKIIPGHPRTVETKLEGDFPPGKVTGTLRISAAQLKQPVKVDYEVTTKWHKEMIIVILLIGLGAGFVIRSILQARIELNEVKQQGFDLLAQMGRAHRDYKDPKFQSDLQCEIETLDRVIRSGTPESISAAIEAAKAKLESLLADLDTRLKTVQASFDGFEDLTDTDWYVAKDVLAVLEQARLSADEIRRHLEDRNAQDAQQQLEVAREKLNGAVREAAVDWRKEIRDEFETYDSRNRPPELTEVPQSIAAIAQQLRNLPVDAVKPDAGTLLPLLHEISWQIGDLVRSLSRNLIGLHSEVVRTVWAAPEGLDLVRALDEAYERLAAAVDDVADDAGRALAVMIRELESLQTVIEDSLRATVTEADPVVQKEVEDALLAADYKAAMQTVANFLSSTGQVPAPAQAEAYAVDRPELAFASSALARAFATLTAGKPARVKVSQRFAVRALPPDFDVRRAASLKALMKAKSWQTVGFGILIGVGGYAIFEKDFVGTWPNVISVFLWAYALDLTGDALAGVISKVPKPKGLA